MTIFFLKVITNLLFDCDLTHASNAITPQAPPAGNLSEQTMLNNYPANHTIIDRHASQRASLIVQAFQESHDSWSIVPGVSRPRIKGSTLGIEDLS